MGSVEDRETNSDESFQGDGHQVEDWDKGEENYGAVHEKATIKVVRKTQVVYDDERNPNEAHTGVSNGQAAQKEVCAGAKSRRWKDCDQDNDVPCSR